VRRRSEKCVTEGSKYAHWTGLYLSFHLFMVGFRIYKQVKSRLPMSWLLQLLFLGWNENLIMRVHYNLRARNRENCCSVTGTQPPNLSISEVVSSFISFFSLVDPFIMGCLSWDFLVLHSNCVKAYTGITKNYQAYFLCHLKPVNFWNGCACLIRVISPFFKRSNKYYFSG